MPVDCLRGCDIVLAKTLKLFAVGHATYRRAKARLFKACYRQLFARCGRGVTFDPVTSHISYSHTSVGCHVFIGGHAWWSGSSDAPIRIGSFVMFGPHVTLLCGDHEIDRLGVPMALIPASERAPERSAGITIEDDVWIGANTTILKGVTVGRGAVVAAGSVVTRSVPAFHVAAGVPAKVVRERFAPELLAEHLRRTDAAMAAQP